MQFVVAWRANASTRDFEKNLNPSLSSGTLFSALNMIISSIDTLRFDFQSDPVNFRHLGSAPCYLSQHSGVLCASSRQLRCTQARSRWRRWARSSVVRAPAPCIRASCGLTVMDQICSCPTVSAILLDGVFRVHKGRHGPQTQQIQKPRRPGALIFKKRISFQSCPWRSLCIIVATRQP
jgi:hypothetical protein